jgi:hypothetical protein
VFQAGKDGVPIWRISVSRHWVLVAVIVLAAGFVVFCLVDLARAEKVRYLPKWLWAILCMGVGLTIPFGGILYLVAGKDRHPPSASHQVPPRRLGPQHDRRWDGLRPGSVT